MSGPTLFERVMPAIPSSLSTMTTSSCPKCGTGTTTPGEAHQRILDLEAQVKALNTRAAAAVDKLADYEDEVRSLREQCAKLQQPVPLQPQTPSEHTPDLFGPPSFNSPPQISPPRAASRLASLSSFLPGRRKELASSAFPTPTLIPTNHSTPNLPSAPQPGDPVSINTKVEQLRSQSLNLESLQSSLEAEKARRLRAESSLNQTQTEIEELTASLFGQANEMVATERKARVKLEERVKLLETRDTEKRKRLDRLEKAMQRIERLRGLVEKSNVVHGQTDTQSPHDDISELDKDDSEEQVERTKVIRDSLTQYR